MRLNVRKDIESLRRKALERVDRWAVFRRSEVQTPGMESIYDAKRKEAETFLSTGVAGPFLELDPGENLTMARLWLRKSLEAERTLAELETRRQGLKTKIKQALNEFEIDAILSEIS